MTYDWKRLERDEARKQNRLTIPLGIGFTAAGVLTFLTYFIFGRPDNLGGGVVFLLIGVTGIVIGVRLRRRNSRENTSNE